MEATSSYAAACPLCGAEQAIEAHSATLTVGDTEVRHRVGVCVHCGLTHAVTDPEFDWPSLYGSVWREPPPSTDHLARFDADTDRIGAGEGRLAFEIGCSSGLLLDRLRQRGWRTAGCDPDDAAVATARAKGHDVQHGVFAPERSGVADLVVMGDVLEHLPRPLEALAGVRSMLGPEGRAYLRVPNVEDLSLETLGEVFNVQHRVVFTPATLSALLGAAGLEAEWIETPALTVTALARRGVVRTPEAAADVRDRSIACVRDYSERLAARRAGVCNRLDSYRGRALVLYGAGTHAADLLRHTSLGELASRLVDSDEQIWGQERYGMRVESPRELRDNAPEVIVIASRAYQEEIARDLADLSERGVEVVRLYERGGLF